MSTKYDLGFISDSDLFNHVKSIIELFRSKVDLEEFNKNIIDPIKLTFDGKVYKKSFNEIIESEILRQIDKSNNNHIGYFHQYIFKYIGGDEWTIPEAGFDIVNHRRKIFVEVKNKHNTMNSSSSQKTYMMMQSQLVEDPSNTCMLVEVISKESQNIPWKISLDGFSIVHENIRKVSMDKFYEIVTSDKLAFYKLCMILPQVIDNVLEDFKEDMIITGTVLADLEKLFNKDDLMKSLYLLAFEKYDGFSNLKSIYKKK